MGTSKIGALALALVLTLPATMPAHAQDVPGVTPEAPVEGTPAPMADMAAPAPAVDLTAATTTAAAPAAAPAPAASPKASLAEKATAILGGAAAGFAAFKLIKSALKPRKEAAAETPQP